MYCAISGEIPKEPVVAKTSGLLFEKSLIEKALRVEGRCPVTGQVLSEDDLVAVKASKLAPARTTAPVSVPGLLHSLQQEWDEHVLESFQLKAQLEATRKELAHSLYQHDAACRVIARLMRELDESRHLLKQFQASSVVVSNGAASASAMDVDETATPAAAVGVSKDVLDELNSVCKSLSATRKGRKASESLVSKESMPSLRETAQLTPHKSTSSSSSSVLSLAVNAAQSVIATGGADHAIVLSDLGSGKTRCKINGHTDAVSHVSFAPNQDHLRTVFSASRDRTVKVWSANGTGGYQQETSFAHASAVTGLAVHPSAHFLVSTTANHQWHFYDVSRKSLLATVADKDPQTVFSSCGLHPDGLILGTGTASGVLKVWDTREQKNVSDLTGHTAAIRSLAFSENGYWAVSGSANGEVKLWDLRKLATTKSLEVGTVAVDALAFDYSGVYLGIACGRSVQVQVAKEWVASAALTNVHQEAVTGLAWATNASHLVTSSQDGAVKVFTPK